MMRTLLIALLVVVAAPARGADGPGIYATECASCHMPGGKGAGSVYPPLGKGIVRFAGTGAGRAYLARVVAYGMSGPITVEGKRFDGHMPAFEHLAPAEIAAALNHILAFERAGAPARAFDAREVARLIRQPATPEALRAEREALSARAVGDARAEPPVIHGAAEDYARHCKGCHSRTGDGLAARIPSLRGFAGYFARSPSGRRYLVQAPGVALANLPSDRLAMLMNWVLHTYSADELPADFRPYSVREVETMRQEPLSDPADSRRLRLRELRAAGLIPVGLTGFPSTGPSAVR